MNNLALLIPPPGAHSAQEAGVRARPHQAVIVARVVGTVQYRAGDGVLVPVCKGWANVQVGADDVVLSWEEDGCRGAAAIPRTEFDRYVAEGALLLAPRGFESALPPDSALRFRPPANQTLESTMSQRLDYYKASREATNAMINLEKAVSQFGLEPALLELVRLRASQINGCAYCIDYHTAEARKGGESDRRLHGVLVWRETPFFSQRERAALAWTESLTRLPDTQAADADYELVRQNFSDAEVVNLTVAIIAVNGWNRLGVGFRRSPEL